MKRGVLDGWGVGIVTGDFVDEVLDDYLYFLLCYDLFQLGAVLA